MAEQSPTLTAQTLKVLAAMVADVEGEWYGLELSKRSGLKPGTIYPILNRLLEAEWVERRWEDIDPALEGRPKRRLYRLTRIGVPAATSAIEEHVAALRPSRPPALIYPTPRPGLT